jgi:hypothetical protein
MRERRKRKTETANTRMDITLSCFARAKERVDKRRERGEGREWRRHSDTHSKCSETSVRVPIATCWPL